MQSHFVDIDELVLRCRDDEARKYISEAIACYKSGAYRACIVMTWVAVVYEFLYKLRELKVEGNGLAGSKLQDHDNARISGDYKKLSDFENEILNWSHRDFEFITLEEKRDLERLKDDRNRCAHPSMETQAQPYQPTAEQARYHLRNAVMQFLQYPALQARAGSDYVDYLLDEVEMTTFSQEIDKALVHYQSTNFKRTRQTVVRSFAQALTRWLISDDIPNPSQKRRIVAALSAIRRIPECTETVEGVLRIDFPKAAEKPEIDEHFDRVVYFLRYVPDTFGFVPMSLQERIKIYIENEYSGDGITNAIELAIREPSLQETAIKRLNNEIGTYELATSTLIRLVSEQPRVEYSDALIHMYETIGDFYPVNDIARGYIIPTIEKGEFDIELYVPRIFAAYESGSHSIINSNSFSDIMRALSGDVLSENMLQKLENGYPLTWKKYHHIFVPDNDNNIPF